MTLDRDRQGACTGPRSIRQIPDNGELMSRYPRTALGVLFCSIPALLAMSAFCPIDRPVLADEPSPPVAPAPSATRLARPVSLAYIADAQRLLVANRDSGTIATIDPVARKVLGHWQIPDAEQLADMIVSADERFLLICSLTQNRVWLLQRISDTQFAVLQTITVPAGPVGLSWLPSGSTLNSEATVACQWGRVVLFLKLNPDAAVGARLEVRHTVALNHAPRRMLPIQDGARLIVADAFGGLMSVIKSDTGAVERTKKLPGHNLHALGMLPQKARVVVAHQILNPVAETSRDGVFWGIVMSNNLRLIPLENFLRDDREPLQDADIHFLGEPNHGAGDPTGIAMGRYDIMLTTLGGVDELAVGVHLDHSFDRIKVGRNPVAVVTDPGGDLAYVANQFSDSVSVVEIKTRKLLGEIPLLVPEQSRLPSLVERGEILFHDANLSLDGWYSCHSCHSSGHTVSLLNDNLGDGNYGAPKRIPSLLGIEGTAPFLWSGRRSDLSEQTRKSITTTMHGEDPTDDQLKALVAYMRALPPPPKITPADQARVVRGGKIFETRSCSSCHTAPTYTSADVYDVDLEDQQGRKQFNPPSLRGVRYRGPYLHDHRAATLSEVFVKHKHPEPASWSAEELADLIAFLESL